MKKYLPLVLLGCSILMLFFFGVFIQFAFHSGVRKPFQDPALAPQLILKKSVIVGWDQGRRLWKFRGDILMVEHSGRFLTYQGNGVAEAFYDDKPFLTIQAPEIRFDLLNKNVQAFQGVRLYAKPSTTLVTQDLYWEQGPQRLMIPGRVYVKSRSGKFWGRNLTLLAYQGKLEVSGVHMILHIRKPSDLQQLNWFSPRSAL